MSETTTKREDLAAELERLFRELNVPAQARFKLEVKDHSVLISPAAAAQVDDEEFQTLLEEMDDRFGEAFKGLAG